jgi:beta-hydroxylase
MQKPVRDYAYDVGAWLLAPLERVVVRSSLVPTTPFLDATAFNWIPRLEQNWRVIREELDGLLERQQDLPALHEIVADAGDISTTTRGSPSSSSVTASAPRRTACAAPRLHASSARSPG